MTTETGIPILEVALNGLGIQTGVGYRKGRDDGMCSPAAQTTHPNDDDVNILVVLEIPGVAGPAMHIFAPRTFLESKQCDNCGFFSQRFIVLKVYDEI